MHSTPSITTVGLLLLLASSSAPGAPTSEDAQFFENRVRPVLVEHCQSCHGPDKQRGGLRLDGGGWLLKGGDGGAVVVPGQPEKSRLLQALHHTGDLKMPPKMKLPAPVIEALTRWVQTGAHWPDDQSAGPLSVEEVRRRHWAFQPIRKPTLPGVKHPEWVQTPVDAFILHKLEASGLSPAKPADVRTLVRRMTLDLHGLPPTPEEIAGTPRERGMSELVDRLLASPRYGESWGRHWLDVARYADTKGYVFQEERRYPFAYTYRDYVIRSFNQDKPFDRFILEQLAADQLDLGEDKRPLAALGFLTLGRRFLNNVHDIIDDRIDVTMRGFQAMTVSCARCHDHKFDPIPIQDYYSLYGVFASCVEPRDLPVIAVEDNEESRAFEAELQRRRQAVEDFRTANAKELAARNRKFRDQLRGLERKVEEWKVTSPASPPRAMVLEDMPRPRTPHVFLRGNPNNAGKPVPRQYLEVVAGADREPFRMGSGRLELAQTIADRDNPLTARVIVNRVWAWHFGQGLVTTPSDFGLRGDPPSHPELLDWLAADFMEHGWSIKHLHRLIMRSNTYQQSSVADGNRGSQVDPDNRLLWRMNRRRLEFEAMRDSLLLVAGTLDETRGGRPVDLLKTPFSTRRTVYGFIDRQNLPGIFRTFDLASPDASSSGRHVTTTPQQALFLMNSPFVIEQARAFAGRPDVTSQPTTEARIEAMYRLAYGRAPEPEEMALGKQFLGRTTFDGTPPTGGKALNPWEKYAQVLLLSNEFAFID